MGTKIVEKSRKIIAPVLTVAMILMSISQAAFACGPDESEDEHPRDCQSGVSGMKFLDANGNGKKDAGEAGLGGWEIWIDLNKNGIKDPTDPSTTTSNDGTYRLLFQLPCPESATFKVYEVQKAGYTQTYPACGYNSVSLSPGHVAECVDFGNFQANPHITLTKTSAENGYDEATDTIHYTLVATNDGNVPLHNVTISDPQLGTLYFTPSAPATLQPGKKLTATGIHTVTQADVDEGHVFNKATASGLDPQCQQVSSTAEWNVPYCGEVRISLTKVAEETSFDSVGDVIHYTLVAKNVGHMTLHNVTIIDPMLGVLTFTPTAPATLGYEETLKATGIHVVTQADLDAGHLYNVATVNGLGPQCQAVFDTAEEDVLACQNAHISLTKIATETSFDAVGDVIHYTLTATNDGNVTLHSVTITDPKLDTITFVPDAPATLAPGQTLTATGTHVVTQADIDAGHLYNIATATGLDPKCQQISDMADEDVLACQDAHISLTKVATETSFDAVGDVIHYTLTATNDGNVTLQNVIITDPMLGVLAYTPAAPATLAPGQTLTATGTHVVIQADLDEGHFYNTATATGLDPKCQQISDTAEEDVLAYQNAHISLIKVATETIFDAVGDVIHYTLTATNDGNVTLYNVSITDPKLETMTFTPAALATLAPGQTLTATGTHTITQADIDNGTYLNSAEASGIAPDETKVSDADVEEVTAGQNPSISIDKTTNGSDGMYIPVGSVVTWAYLVNNTGNVTLSNIVVTDSDLGIVGTIPTLAPGASATLTKTGTAVSGAYSNTATVVGTPPLGNDVTDTDDSSYFGSAPGILIEKTVKNITANGPEGKTAAGTVGDDFRYTLIVTNTGNVALSNIVITDDKAVVGSSVTVNGTATTWASGTGGIATLTVSSLSPGQSATIIYVYDTTPGSSAIAARINLASVRAIVSHTADSQTPTQVSDDDSAKISTVLGVARTGETNDGIGNLYAVAFVLTADGLLVTRRVRKFRNIGLKK